MDCPYGKSIAGTDGSIDGNAQHAADAAQWAAPTPGRPQQQQAACASSPQPAAGKQQAHVLNEGGPSGVALRTDDNIAVEVTQGEGGRHGHASGMPHATQQQQQEDMKRFSAEKHQALASSHHLSSRQDAAAAADGAPPRRLARLMHELASGFRGAPVAERARSRDQDQPPGQGRARSQLQPLLSPELPPAGCAVQRHAAAAVGDGDGQRAERKSGAAGGEGGGGGGGGAEACARRRRHKRPRLTPRGHAAGGDADGDARGQLGQQPARHQHRRAGRPAPQSYAGDGSASDPVLIETHPSPSAPAHDALAPAALALPSLALPDHLRPAELKLSDAMRQALHFEPLHEALDKQQPGGLLCEKKNTQ